LFLVKSNLLIFNMGGKGLSTIIENHLYRCDEIRSIEKRAINDLAISEQELMHRAGQASFDLIHSCYPKTKHVNIFCGSGNNAGDGYVLAKLLKQSGIFVKIFANQAIDKLPPTAKQAALDAQTAHVIFEFDAKSPDIACDLIVDALLGIGLNAEVRGSIAECIAEMNASEKPILSLDLPSGLNADTGKIYNISVKASHTITFIAAKAGMYTLDGPDCCGHIHCDDLGLEKEIKAISPYAICIDKHNVKLPLAVRKKNTHKGDFGRLLVIGGGLGMPGAAILTARAAFRTGVGAVMVATRKEHVAALLPVCPEAMIHGVDCAEDLKPLLALATVVAIGPGLGETAWGREMFDAVIKMKLPMVIDASALKMLPDIKVKGKNWVLTPHPGEAASLLGLQRDEIQNDRFKAVKAIQDKYQAVVVLKGVGSLIQSSKQPVYVSTSGNPGMATAGMGDVLTGMIAALIGQSLSLDEAAKIAVWLHAYIADRQAEMIGCRGLLASDLLDQIPKLINGKAL
jgi:hydroxyethylthiazole kinase-like uncharacterized protein yjeF